MPEPGSVRLFVAVYPTPEAAKALLAALRAVKLPVNRPVPVDQVHLTLHFIGSVPSDELALFAEGVGSAAEGIARFALAPQKLIALPPHRSARLIAAEMNLPPELLELHRRVAARIHAERDEGDRFLPHMTLCRFREPARVPPLEAPLRVAPFSVSEVALVRSTLRPGGAVHERVESYALSAH